MHGTMINGHDYWLNNGVTFMDGNLTHKKYISSSWALRGEFKLSPNHFELELALRGPEKIGFL